MAAPANATAPAITLLTDFGGRDHFVAAMKGVIATRAPGVPILDLGHELPPHDVEAAAFFLLCCYGEFPPGTVHTVVVDPGVGTARAPIAVRAGDYLLVGPDNGVFSHVAGRVERPEFRRLAGDWLPPPRSTTFHGRDVFAPAAAALAMGMPFDEVGPLLSDPVRLPAIEPKRDLEGRVRGRVLAIDRFGNIVTSLSAGMLPPGTALRIGDRAVDQRCTSYEAAIDDEPFLIEGSAGFIEVSLRRRSAAESLGVRRGDEVTVVHDI